MPLTVVSSFRWIMLLVFTVLAVMLFDLLNLSASLLLGPMFVAIVFAVLRKPVSLNSRLMQFSQAVVGAMIARAMPGSVFLQMQQTWPIFILTVVAVISVSTFLGGLLTKFRILPGTTALWGSSPGAATAMTLMAGSFGADVRLVAFMQYLRVLLVALLATGVSWFYGPDADAPVHTISFLAKVDFPALGVTLLIILAGWGLAQWIRLPAGPMLITMVLANLMMNGADVPLELPQPLLAVAYTFIGWSIGMRFSGDILRYTLHALPGIIISVMILLTVCGGIAWLLVRFAGIDPLTAYLATSPGGADSVAIIASGVQVDQPFIISMQTGRFIVVLLVGPALYRLIARWVTE